MITTPTEPHKFFNIIREGLEAAIAKSGDYVSVGQVFQGLQFGDNVLYMFWEEDTSMYLGFGISELLHTANGTWINVPFAYAKDDMYMEFFSYLSEIAVENGMTGVKFVSSREGFSKKAKEFGWKKGFTEWIVTDLRGSK